MISEIHKRLRAATGAEHQRLEGRVRILERIGATASRRTLLDQFHRLHSEVETAISPCLADLDGLDFAARRRTARLAEDMAELGLPVPAPSRGIPQARSIPEALGLMYVLEGSTLGGRVIRREAAARGLDMCGLSFLDPYGAEVGNQWKSFLTVLARCVRTSNDADSAVAGARAGFRHAERHLGAETADV
jgi:heme oxygenase